ncbi:hypothetical protein N9R39_06250, partial [Amylibacter sp.]|nr:hypothetical protein [Amylibacter sp.]
LIWDEKSYRIVTRFDRLNSKILNAHKNGNINILVDIYFMLGNEELKKSAIKSGCFLLTQAFVYALESGDCRAKEIREILISYGREE